MRLERTFTVAINAASTRQLTITYFTQADYTLKQDQQERLVFSRGSLLGTLTGYNPKSWAAKVTASISPLNDQVIVHIDYSVNTIGQIVTANESAWWDAEIDGLGSVLKVEQSVDTLVESGDANAASVANQGLRIGWTFLAAVVVIGLAVGFVGNALLDSIPSTGVLIGLTVAVGLIVVSRFGGFGRQRR